MSIIEYDWSSDPGNDLTPRYAPKEVMTGQGMRPVVTRRFYPVGHPVPLSPIRKDMGVLEMITDTGVSRWHGCKRAYINSELRMVVCGINTRDEVVRKWKVVPEDKR